MQEEKGTLAALRSGWRRDSIQGRVGVNTMGQFRVNIPVSTPWAMGFDAGVQGRGLGGTGR
jgi:hypothetical protein